MANKKVKNVESDKASAEKNRMTRINSLLKQLKEAKQRHEKCRLRGQLRKLNHFGGLRNRTYLDKTNDKTVVIEKKKAKAS